MIEANKKHRNKSLFIIKSAFLLTGIAIILLVTFWPSTAAAFIHEGIAKAIASVGIKFFAYILNAVTGAFLTLASLLVDFALYLNTNLLADSTLVKVGWGISRDLANLGFVLAIIVIAFTTMFRIREHEVAKLLPKLIAAAILVNFSLSIALFIVDFSHMLTNFFLKDRLGITSGWEISATIADAFGPQRLLIQDETALYEGYKEDLGGVVLEFGAALVVTIIGLGFSIVFTLLNTVVFLALAIMLIIRYVWLSILMILTPIVWLFWIFPQLATHWHTWWNKFISWTFFLPAVAFSIYLTLSSAKKMSFQPPTVEGFSGALSEIVSQGAQMVAMSGLLIGGLIVSQTLGITGAAAAVEAARGVGRGLGNYAKMRAEKVGRGVGKSRVGQFAKRQLEKLERGPRSRIGRLITAPVRTPVKQAREITEVLTKKEAKPTTLAGFITKGAKAGSGLWKKKK